MPSPIIKQDRRYTYADYLTWPDDERWELIDGVPYLMSPAPTDKHQDAQLELALIIDAFLKGKPCNVRTAPQDVRFENDFYSDTVVQPDLVIWCKPKDNSDAKSELTIVIEILSPSTSEYDLGEKRELYERSNISEYWVVSLEKKRFSKYVMTNGKYKLTTVPSGDFTSERFPGLSVNVEEFFEAVQERNQYRQEE